AMGLAACKDQAAMSGSSQERHFGSVHPTSALPLIAARKRTSRDFRVGPHPDSCTAAFRHAGMCVLMKNGRLVAIETGLRRCHRPLLRPLYRPNLEISAAPFPLASCTDLPRGSFAGCP